jgi:hypothetical protein
MNLPSSAFLLIITQVHAIVDSLPKKDFWDKFYVCSTFALALVAALTLVVIAYQAKKTADAAEATEKNVEAVLNSSRAWILVDPGVIPDDFEPDPNLIAFLEIRPIIKNYGKTPAKITRMGISQVNLPTNDKLPPEPTDQHVQSADIVLPPDLPIQPLKLMIAQTDFIEVRRGDPLLYVHGFVDYVDLGDRPRTSRFCFIYNVPSGFTSLKRGFYIPGNVPPAYTKCT